MDRRQFLALSSIGMIGTAGCTSGGQSSNNSGDEATASGAGSAAAVGKTATSENGIAMTVTDAQLANDVMTPDGELTPEGSGQRLALVRVEAQNTADEPRDLPSRDEIVMVTGGGQYSAQTEFGYSEDEYARLTEPVSGEFYQSVSKARPSVSSSGWLLFEVPENTESGRISWSREIYTDQGSTTLSAEWRGEFHPDQLSNVKITNIDAPSTARHHHSVDVILEVSNDGGAEGTLETAITSEDLDEPVPVSVTVEPGETKTVAVSAPYPEIIMMQTEDGPLETTYSVNSQSFTVTFQSPTLNQGEGITYPNGVYLEVDQIQRISEYVTESPFGDLSTRQPGDGEQFFAFQFRVENRSDQTVGQVGPWNFNFISEQEYGANVEQGRGGGSISGSVNGDVFAAPESIPPNESTSGWVILEVTEGLGSDVFLEYQNTRSDSPMLAPKWRI